LKYAPSASFVFTASATSIFFYGGGSSCGNTSDQVSEYRLVATRFDLGRATADIGVEWSEPNAIGVFHALAFLLVTAAMQRPLANARNYWSQF
jgi:hypothetical protein